MSQAENCIICLDNKWLTKTPCKHTICVGCIFRLEKDECPMCRRTLLDKFPKIIIKYLKINKEKDVKKSSNLNLFDESDFPPLG